MQRCQQCGQENETDDRYCGNCGAELSPASASIDSERSPTITSQSSDFGSERRDDPDQEREQWRMSSLGPPPAKKRRLWLWIVLGLLGLCLLVCVGIVIFASTGTGQEWIEDLSTRAAEEATGASR